MDFSETPTRWLLRHGLSIAGGQDAPEPDPEPEPEPSPEPEPEPEPKPAESFIDPKDLPEEIKPHWSRMHRAYTKKLDGVKARQADLDLLDNFRSNPEFAVQLLQQEATRFGYQLTKPGGAAAGGTGGGPTGPAPPPELVDAVRQQLPPELQWMAPAQAAAFWAANRLALAPMLQSMQRDKSTSRAEEFDALSAELSDESPGWEAHEDDMDALLAFFQSDRMRHPVFGSKLKLLARLVTGEGAAIAEATRRQTEAARNRSVTGRPTGRATPDNLTERIRKASSDTEAWEIAGQEAAKTVEASGRPVR